MFLKVQQYLFAFILLLATTSSALAGIDEILYCGTYSEQYREMEYWARVSISVSDYEYKSGDARALKLVTGKEKTENVNKEIYDYFIKEFERLVKGKIQYHDVDAGIDKRIAEFYRKNPSEGQGLYERFKAYDEARIRSLYGNKPAALYCNIRISRSEFPVLYQIKTNVIASEELINGDHGASCKSLEV